MATTKEEPTKPAGVDMKDPANILNHPLAENQGK